jgi:hypothetical protein
MEFYISVLAYYWKGPLLKSTDTTHLPKSLLFYARNIQNRSIFLRGIQTRYFATGDHSLKTNNRDQRLSVEIKSYTITLNFVFSVNWYILNCQDTDKIKNFSVGQ